MIWYGVLASFGIVLLLVLWMGTKTLIESYRLQHRPAPKAFYDTIPDIPFKNLSPAQRESALRLLNSTNCICSCELTLAQCRNTGPSCKQSLDQASKILKNLSG